MSHSHSLSPQPDINIKDYSNPNIQDAFMMLPEIDRVALINLHQSHVDVMNGPETIEIAGMRILGKPIETIGMTPEQKGSFEKAGWLIQPNITDSIDPKNQNKMMYWETDYNEISGEVSELVNGKKIVNTYAGYELYRRIFPEHVHLSEEQARSQGLMTRYDRNHWAREDFAKKSGGKQATPEQLDIIYAEAQIRARAKSSNATNLEILSEMGQKLLGWRRADDGKVYNVGEWSGVGSRFLYADADVHARGIHRDESRSRASWNYQRTSLSSVVVMDNGVK
jgi:hypothetical protein